MLDNQITKHRSRLTDLLTFARQQIPCYRAYIPTDIDRLVSSSRQWQQLPMLNKRQIQSNWEGFLAYPSVTSNPTVKITSTSGSTGTPLKIARPISELRAQTKRLWVTRRAHWHPNIMRWTLLSLFRNPESPSQKTLNSLLSVANDDYVDISFPALDSCLDLIDDYKPDWIYGSPSTVYRLAEKYRQAQRSIPTLKLIEVTSEQLYPHQRALIENVFGCPLVNHYGCQEFWVLSYECPAHSMHAWTDNLLLEVVQNGHPVPAGETGELVITSLTNRVMPLIRYRLGDLVQMYPSSCSCGDPSPILIPIGGRVGSLITTRQKTIPAGLLNGVFSRFILHHEQTLLEYQVVQSDCDLLEIYLVPGERFEKKTAIEKITEAIHRLLPAVHCEFHLRSSIVPMPSGKIETFISRLPATADP